MTWSSATTRRIRRIALTILAGVAVAGCGWGAQADGWSVRMYNPWSDFIVRFTSDALTTYVRLPAGAEGVAVTGEGATPHGANIALLDPMSCRVISMIEDLPADHAYISTSWGGTLDVAPYDPRDYGDPADQADQLVAAVECTKTDASSRPLPLPPMESGEWLNEWEMYCEATSAGAPFGVRGEFLKGAASGCEALPGHDGGGTTGGAGVGVWHPGGDPLELGATWFDTACANGATVSFVPTFGGYKLHVISTAAKCAPRLHPYSAVFHLTEPIDVRLIDASIERLVD